ncbi:MAG: hypothetical protein E6K64_02415 [Nitrospirae bacterium]|nr:MAG: hypothetical protein E6K64_02415 [Nitrospirota bacterium]
MSRSVIVLVSLLLLAGCASNPYLEQSLKPAAQRHESKDWFEKEWGKPSGASKRFWGGETWTYYRIAGGTQRILGGINPHECEITLYFNKEGTLDDYSYSSGC